MLASYSAAARDFANQSNDSGNPWSKSNYIGNMTFAKLGHSRSRAIDLVEVQQTQEQILSLLQGHQDKYYGCRCYTKCKYLAWTTTNSGVAVNFHNLRKDCQTIEFRRGSWSKFISPQ